MHESHETFPPGVRVFRIGELEHLIRNYSRNFLNTDKPAKPRKRVVLRTVIGKAGTSNADQLRTAITTSMLLIEEKLNAVAQERPNSDSAKAQRDETIDELKTIKGQLQEIGQLPDQLKNGQVKEVEAAKKVKTFADGIRGLWEKKHEAICSRAFDLALFSSYVLVGSLAGAPGGWTLAVSAAMVGGKPVMDSLKGLRKKLFH